MNHPFALSIWAATLSLAAISGQARAEQVGFVPGFHYSQDSKKLGSIFHDLPPSGSELCFPTSLAHSLTFLQSFNDPKAPGLLSLPAPPPAGSVEPFSGGDHDWLALVDELTKDCQTSITDGTSADQGQACVQAYLKASGYPGSCSLLIGPAVMGASVPNFTRALTISDLRNYLKAQPASGHFGVILLIGWYTLDATSRTLVRAGGHFVDLYGFDYQPSWDENRIDLKVVDPLANYVGRTKENMFDEVLMTSIDPAGAPVTTDYGPFQYELTGNIFSYTSASRADGKPLDAAEASKCSGPPRSSRKENDSFTDNCGVKFPILSPTSNVTHAIAEEILIFSPLVSEEACEAIGASSGKP